MTDLARAEWDTVGAMAVTPDDSRTASEAAAHRRWLITIVITVVFGCFGAVLAYLSYAKTTAPAAPSSSGTSGPAPAAQPSTDDGGKSDPHKGKPDKNR